MFRKLAQVLAILFISLTSFAQNFPEFIGQYQFSPENLQLVQLQHRLIILRRSPESISYINQLQSTGYTCQPKAQLQYQCIRFEKQFSNDLAIRDQLIKKFQGTKIEFTTPQSPYQQISSSSSLQEYLRLQNSQFLNKNYNRVRLLILPTVTKIELKNNQSADTEYLIYQDEKTLIRMQRVVQAYRPQLNFILNEDRLLIYDLVWQQSLFF